MVTGLIFVQNATPETITQLHDQLSNELPTLRGKWSFSFKIFRNNPYSIPPGNTKTDYNPKAKFVHTFQPSYAGDTCVCLLNRKTLGVFSNVVLDEQMPEKIGSSQSFGISADHMHRGATTGINDSFDFFINQKLQSLWTQKQNVKGDGGQIYELENGNLVIRTSNVFLHGIFKGLLIQIEVGQVPPGTTHDDAIQKVVTKYSIPSGTVKTDVLDSRVPDTFGDLCLQYSLVLNL